MAKRPSIKEILDAARKGGAAKPAEGESAAGSEPEVAAAEAEATAAPEVAAPPPKPAPAARPAPAAKAPTPAPPGRPLTLKEKLAAARAGGAPAPAAAAETPAAASEAEPAIAEAAAEETVEAPKPVPAAPREPLGRPMTLAEKLAAARGGAAAAPAGAAAPAKPAAAKAAAAPAAKAGAARTLPPLEKMTDPKDLAEAARQAGAKKARELAAKVAATAPAPAAAKAAAKASPKPQTVPPRPTRELAAAAAGAAALGTSRRGVFIGGLLLSWIAIAWTTFTAGITAMTLMTLRFMFPNVLAEPPSTIKIGLPSDYEPEAVNEKYKAESQFWVVRSTKYNGQDIIYALQSICTHLGCPPNWLVNEQKFKCPCHGSGFYISGINFEGPAPRPLERFKVALADDGQIVVDKSQKFQQELGQWSDPDSFIPV
jgi:cytochrome b6-f complex iron-sulfur subunit